MSGKWPSPEELKFVYELIKQGYTAQDLYDKYLEMERYGKLGHIFPENRDKRSFGQRVKEYEAAKDILKIPTHPDYVIEHWNELTTLVKEFLRLIDQYTFGVPHRSTDEHILDIDGMESWAFDNAYLSKNLILHLKNEFPKEFEGIHHWDDIFKFELPHGCREKLKLVAHRKTFTGTCEICQDM